jgi:hypothetical protein
MDFYFYYINMSQLVPVSPYTITTVQTISQISVTVTDMVLYTSASLFVQCFDASSNLISSQVMIIDGDAYASWGGNDDYVYNFVAKALGTTYTPPS